MNKRARCGVAPPGDVFYAFRQTPTRSLSLSLNTTKKEEEKIGTRRDKIFAKRKKNLVSTDLFLTSCGFFVDFMLLLLLRISRVLNLCVCVCVCVLHVFMYVSLYTMLLEVVVVIMALSSRPEVNLLRVRKSL